MTCDNELQITLKRVNRCLKRAILENHGKPISFYKFAIDPFSLTYTVENLFNLASLVKDGIIIIERVPGYNLHINIAHFVSCLVSFLVSFKS